MQPGWTSGVRYNKNRIRILSLVIFTSSAFSLSIPFVDDTVFLARILYQNEKEERLIFDKFSLVFEN